MLKLEAMFSRLIVEPVGREKVSAGGIIIADGHESGAQLYRVLSIGSHAGKRDGVVHETFKIGDTLLIHKNKVIRYDHSGQSFYSVPDDQVIAKVVE